MIDVVAENVDLGARHVAVDLEPGHDGERRMARRLVDGVAEPLRRIVIGHREHAHATSRGGLHQLARRQRAVRRRRVRVQVDAPTHYSYWGPRNGSQTPRRFIPFAGGPEMAPRPPGARSRPGQAVARLGLTP